jgi:hypothetical protein
LQHCEKSGGWRYVFDPNTPRKHSKVALIFKTGRLICMLLRILLSEMWGALFLMWLMHFAVAIVPCGAIWWLGRKRVRWSVSDYLIVVIPYFVWALLFVTGEELDWTHKGWGNVNYEPIALALLSPIAPMMKVQLRNAANNRLLTVAGLSLLTAAGIMIWRLLPGFGFN